MHSVQMHALPIRPPSPPLLALSAVLSVSTPSALYHAHLLSKRSCAAEASEAAVGWVVVPHGLPDTLPDEVTSPTAFFGGYVHVFWMSVNHLTLLPSPSS